MPIPTQMEYNVAKQPQRKLFVKMNLLNFDMNIVDELSGIVTQASFTIDANSDIRRSCSVALVVDNAEEYSVKAGNKIWLDKFVQIFVGIEDVYSQEIAYTNQGIYLINNPSVRYDSTNNVLSFQGLDLMSKLTGVRNGVIEGVATLIPVGSNIRNVMIETLRKLTTFTKFAITPNPQSVPYDINLDRGATVYDLLKQLRDITPEWEMFFDENGVFTYRPIPQGKNEPIMLDDDLLSEVCLNHVYNTNFEEVKNVVEVWGRTHNPTYYGGVATVDESTYQVNIPDITTLYNNLTIGFTAPQVLFSPKLQVNEVTYPIVNEDYTEAKIPEENVYYVVRYCDERFIFLGYQQSYGIAKDENPDSPFYFLGNIGTINKVCLGGEYDNIWSDDLARQRARYELYLSARMHDSVTLSCIPIYFLDVNWVVSWTPPNETEPTLWIIKSISTDFHHEGVQSINMIKYYPLYP